jgi:hypothetical protein
MPTHSSGKDKQPKRAFNPNPQKIPNSKAATSYHDENPAWRIRRMDFIDPYGWHKVDATLLSEIREKLSQFETQTWAQILVDAKKQNHSVPVNDLCRDAQVRLSGIFKGPIDVDDLLSLRLSGKERVWGILRKGVMEILWWDPNHLVCPSIKKHT